MTRFLRLLPLALSAALVAAGCSTGIAPSSDGTSTAPVGTAPASELATPQPEPTVAPTSSPSPTMEPTPTAVPVTAIPSPTNPPLGLKTACQIFTAKVAISIEGKGTARLLAQRDEMTTPDINLSLCQREVTTAPLTGYTTTVRVWGARTTNGFVGVRATFDYWSKGGELVPDLAQQVMWVPGTVTPRLGEAWILVDGGSYAIEVSNGGLTKADSINAAKAIVASL